MFESSGLVPAACDRDELRLLLAGLAPEEVPALLHLLGCGACREEADRLLCELLHEVPPRRPEEPKGAGRARGAGLDRGRARGELAAAEA